MREPRHSCLKQMQADVLRMTRCTCERRATGVYFPQDPPDPVTSRRSLRLSRSLVSITDHNGVHRCEQAPPHLQMFACNEQAQRQF